MGREAPCTCRWGVREGRVKALLESTELILRGELRARIALHALENVRAHAGVLTFMVAGERVELELGAQGAQRWATAIATPPPTLAQKIGVTATTRLHVTGEIDDDELRDALANVATTKAPADNADLAIVRTDDGARLADWIAGQRQTSRKIPPLWVVYVKGRNAPLGEGGVREVMRGQGFIDTKVAAVSGRLGATRFTKRP